MTEAHLCKQLTQDRYVIMKRPPGVEPATSQSLQTDDTTTSRHTDKNEHLSELVELQLMAPSDLITSLP